MPVYTCSKCSRVVRTITTLVTHHLDLSACATLTGNNDVVRISSRLVQYDGHVWQLGGFWASPHGDDILTRRDPDRGTLRVWRMPS
jgi:hypothetical protein